MPPKQDISKQGWEQSDFPILCESCLGPNPYMRMTKEQYGKACKICTRPFTVFRWNPGSGSRFKKTEVCQTCARLKNVCQTCLLDLEHHLPVAVRDAVLQVKDAIPTSHGNREYFTQNAEAKMSGSTTETYTDYTKASSSALDALKRLARPEPYYVRNRAHLCSFFAKGTCTRGDECPYRHELPTDPSSDLSKQNLRDRFYGTDDPVAKRMLAHLAGPKGVGAPPPDPTITTIFVSGLPTTATEQAIREAFYIYGELQGVRLLTAKACAFVTFATRLGAEEAMERAGATGVTVGEKSCRISWGRPAQQGPRTEPLPEHGIAPAAQPHNLTADPSGLFPVAPPLPGTAGYRAYPSQDPRQMGASASTSTAAASSSGGRH